MLAGRTGVSISQFQPCFVPPSRIRLEPSRKANEDLASSPAMPREEFLYDFKRRLRAGRKRAVLAAEYRALGESASPARRSTAPPGTPGRLSFPA